MKVKTLHKHYDLIEFHHYIDTIDEEIITSVLELLINSDDINTIEEEFGELFIIQTDDQTYVFSNYELSEYYIVDEHYIKVICVK